MNRLAILIFSLATSVAMSSNARGGTWTGDRYSFDRASHDSPEFHSALIPARPGPTWWFVNTLPGFRLARDGDRIESVRPTANYVDALTNPFDVSLFNNVSTVASPGGTASKPAGQTVLAAGATIRWDGGATGNGSAWASNTNWAGDVLPSDDFVVFDSRTGGGTIATPLTVSADFALRTLTFDTNLAVTTNIDTNGSGSTARSLTLTGDGINFIVLTSNMSGKVLNFRGNNGALTVKLTGSGAFDVEAGTLSFGSAVPIADGASAGGINKTGAGLLILSDANSYTGGTTITAGTLQLSGGTLGATTGSLTANGGTLNLNGTNLSVGNLTGSGGTILNNNTGTSVTLTIGNGNGTGGNYQGVIANNTSGTGTVGLTKNGIGSITLSGANTYTGATVINGGSIQLDNAGATTPRLAGTTTITVNSGGTLILAGSSGSSNDRINDSAKITLNGGGSTTVSLNTSGLSEHGPTNNTAGMGALTLQSSSIIDMGSLSSIVAFANSNSALGNSAAWNGTLSIYNWSGTPVTGGGTDQLYFGNNNTGLDATQLARFQFYTDAGQTPYVAGAVILSTGEVVPTVIPEPSTWTGAALVLGAIGLAQRRKLRRSIARLR